METLALAHLLHGVGLLDGLSRAALRNAGEGLELYSDVLHSAAEGLALEVAASAASLLPDLGTVDGACVGHTILDDGPLLVRGPPGVVFAQLLVACHVRERGRR